MLENVRGWMIGGLLAIAACKGGDPEASAKPVAEKPAGCAFLGEAKVREVTGVAVTTHAHGNPQSCALFKTPEGKDYLLVATDRADTYQQFLDANPTTMLPVRTPVPGVGREAVILRGSADTSSLHMLIAHNDVRTVVFVPFWKAAITEAQIVELARVAMAAP